MARYRFGDCELDGDLFELRVRGEKVAVQPKVLKLLFHLVRNRDRTVTQRELLHEIWEDVKVERSSLSRVVLEARRAIGDDNHTVIVTVRTHGFRFTAEATEIAVAQSPSRAPLIGREASLHALGAGLDAAFAGHGGIAWVSGEAGLGKTRVLDEIAATARARGAQVAVLRCHDAEGQPAFWPWMQLVKSLAAGAPEPVADAAALLASAPAPDFRTFDTVTRALLACASSRPVVMAIDDVHWADDPSLQLLRFAAREIRDARIFVACTYCDTSLAADERARTLGALLSEYGSTAVPLRALSREETARLVQELHGVEPTSAFVTALHERTGGSPRFVHQMLGTEWAKRALEDAARSFASSIDLERGLLESVGRHLDGTSDGCREVLASAAVLGKDFDFPTLAAVVGIEREALVDRLEEAVRMKLLLAAKNGRYRFVHPLVGEVLYKKLGASDRAARHRATATALETLHANALDAHAAEISHHYTRAASLGTGREGFAYSVRAARHAALHGDARATLRLWEQALRALEFATGDEGERIEAHLEIARARVRVGDTVGARASFADAAMLARALGKSDVVAAATSELEKLARAKA
jgi:predicted ATPase/DNA-binding winged helix-turn-helix (wHTH) protein